MKTVKISRIIGIDPGTSALGYSIINVERKVIAIESIGVLHLKKYEDHYKRLQIILERIQSLIQQYRPEEMAIEAPFYGKNIQSMLKLGRAQGVAMAAGMTSGLIVQEYSPRKIKQAITGNGNSTKEQVASMLENILQFKLDEYAWDATDALAVATCHHFQLKNRINGSAKYRDWSSFLKNNPEKLK